MFYSPIDQVTHPALTDKLVYSVKKPFIAMPQLSLSINEYAERVTAVSSYYNHQNPALSSAAEVYYRIERSYSAAANTPILLRHNGNSIDMELYVDTYSLNSKDLVIGQYPPTEALLKFNKQNDKYTKTTMQYVYARIACPVSSNKVWDGSHNACVDLEGNAVAATDRVSVVRAEVKSLLESPSLVPFDIVYMSSGGAGVTKVIPDLSVNQDRYRLELQEFIEKNYNSLGIPSRLSNDIKPEIVRGKGSFSESYVVAVLDGIYFSHWAKLIVLA